ncbi:MAG: sugar ABC transporter permease [Lachnospiraceae bacterium]|nr:sugar ABC transporter permease [Lachnospiraceae bacterium]
MKKKIRVIIRYLPLYLMMVPGFIYLIINNYIPLAGLTIAFKNVNFQKGIWKSDWCGFKNFEFLFRTKDAWIITRNTILYNLAFIVIGTAFAVLIAILVCDMKNRLFAKMCQSIIILPSLISMVVVSVLAYVMLSTNAGTLNKMIKALGGDGVNWYSTPNAWPVIILLVYLWKNAGFQCVLFIASIIGISPDYFEAARIDGATKWQQVRYITLPSIKPTIIMVVILALGKIFYSDFGLFYQVTRDSGALYATTNTIDTYVFRGLITLNDIGMSSAAGFYQSMVGFALVLVSNLIIRKFNKESALF